MSILSEKEKEIVARFVGGAAAEMVAVIGWVNFLSQLWAVVSSFGPDQPFIQASMWRMGPEI